MDNTIQDNVKRLIRESKRFKTIGRMDDIDDFTDDLEDNVTAVNLDELDNEQIKQLRKPIFKKELAVITSDKKSIGNIQKLHRRLDDAILLLADKQSRDNIAHHEDLRTIVKDINTALGL